MSRLHLDSHVVAVDGHVSSSLDDEEVILHLESGVYYGLNAVGAALWAHVQSPTSVRAVCDRLQATFDVERDRLEQDVLRVLREMHDEDLVRLTTPST